MRLIDADALIRQLETQDYSGAPETLEDWTPQDMTKAEIADIQNAPTIEAEPIRHGEWITVTDGIFADKHYCSACMNYAEVDLYGKEILSKYCLECGAHMDKGET